MLCLLQYLGGVLVLVQGFACVLMYLCNCNILHRIHAGVQANEVRLREKNEGVGEGGPMVTKFETKLTQTRSNNCWVHEAICCGNGIN